MLGNITRETLDEANALYEELEAAKAGYSTSGGQMAINLEEFSKLAVPEFSPLRDEIPRTSPIGNVAGLQPQWDIVTSFNATDIKIYVQEGKRGAAITPIVSRKSAPYVTLGLENNLTFEAESGAFGHENLDEQAVLGLMNEMYSQEERVIIGGNAGQALGTAGTIALTDEASGGSLTNTAYYFGVVALTFDGLDLTTANSAVPQSVTNTLAGPYGGTTPFNGGSGQPSAVQTITPAGSGHSVVATVPAVAGALGYAWFMGTASSGGYFAGTSAINSFNFTVVPSSAGQAYSALVAADYSKNALSFDGIFSQTSQNGYIYTMPTGAAAVGGAGTGLTAAPSGSGIGIVEFENVLSYFWNTYRTSIGKILVNAQEMQNITNKILSAGSAPLLRFNYDRSSIENNQVIGGATIGMYLNKYCMGGPQLIPIILHPYVPAGTVLFIPTKIPYRVTNIGTIMRMNTRKDYYAMKWPELQRQREWGVYAEEVLQIYTPFAFGAIVNIANK